VPCTDVFINVIDNGCPSSGFSFSLQITNGVTKAVANQDIEAIPLFLINPFPNFMGVDRLLPILTKADDITLWLTTK
jgi:hypothetical protein